MPAQLPAALVSLTRFTVEPSQASEAVGAVKLGEAGHSIVASLPAAPITGAVVSTTVMVWLRVAEWFPLQSVASQVCVRL